MRDCSIRVIGLLCIFGLLGITGGLVQKGAEKKDEEKYETHVVVDKIPYGAEYEFSRTVGPGRLVKAQNGVVGKVTKTYIVYYKNGKQVEKELVKEERVEPQNAQFLMGRAGFTPSRHKFTRSRVMEMEATAYDPSPETIGPGATGYTRTGMKATFGHVAVDPRVIPLKSLVYVEGYGFAICSDTGGAIKGNRIDLCYDKRSTALRFGRKMVKVHLLKTNN